MASSVAAISSCVAPTRRVIMNERDSRTSKRGGDGESYFSCGLTDGER